MKPLLRRALRWLSWTVTIIFLAGLLWIAPLAYPNPLFDHREQVGNITFHCDAEMDTEMLAALHDVPLRLQAVEIYDPNLKLDVFLCRSTGLYRFLSRLSLVPSPVPGFNLSQAGNSFISLPGIEARQLSSGGFPDYSAISGGLAHTISHELIHNYAVARSGFFSSRGIPKWKSEGYAEYAAGRAVRANDTTATLRDRIQTMMSGFASNSAREYYSYELAVEYLAEVEGFSYDELMADRRPFYQVSIQMMTWFESPNADI